MTTALDDREPSSTEAQDSDAARASARSGGRGPIVLVVFAGAWLAILEAARWFDSDGWWHVRNGALILRHGALPAGDPFSWLAHGTTGVLDGWLFDVSMAGVRGLGGLVAVSLVALTAVVAYGLASYGLNRWTGARQWPSALLAVFALVLLQPFVAERPQMISYLLFAATLVLGCNALRGSQRSLIGLALVIALWANVHLAFSLGVGVVGLAAIGTAITRRSLVRPAIVAGVAVVAGLLNPYGLRAYTIVSGAHSASKFIQEWRHLGFTDAVDVLVMLLIVAAVASTVITGRWRDWPRSLPLLALAILTFDAVRNAPYLVLLAAPEVAIGISRLRERGEARRRAPRDGTRRTALAHGALVGGVLVVAVSAAALPGIRDASPEQYPVRATAAVPAGCRLLNEFDQGGYIAEQRWPAVEVSQDGRMLEGTAALLAQQRVLKAQGRWRAWLDGHRVDCVIARPDRPIVRALTAAGWERAAQDAGGVLLERPAAR